MKNIYTFNRTDYTFNATRKYSKYTFDGVHYKNGGEMVECLLKKAMGYTDYMVKDSIRFDVDSDISDKNCSVKSSDASLYNVFLGADFMTCFDTFFSRVHSNNFSYCVLNDYTLIEYNMSIEQFKTFVLLFGRWDKSRQKIKIKKTNKKMLEWLENNIK
jgi:hypothetical protein